jgi:hypothetical protein
MDKRKTARRPPGTSRPPRKSAPKARSSAKSRSGGNSAPDPADWRAATLKEVRRLILAADPDIVEERKWIKPSNPAGVPVWSRAGIVCTGETYKRAVKLTFARGASLPDPHRLFNSSLAGGTRRAIDLREGESLPPAPFQALVQAAIAENLRTSAAKSKSRPTV